MTPYKHMVTLLAMMSAATVVSHAGPVRAQPSAAQVLSDMGWSATDQQRVLNGEFVTNDLAGVSDTDLALAIAFLVKTSPEDLSQQIIAGSILSTDPQVRRSGEFNGAGSLADLARLEIDADTAGALSKARPGEALNLSAGEIAAFNALQSAGAGSRAAASAANAVGPIPGVQGVRLTGIAAVRSRREDHRRSGGAPQSQQRARELQKYMPAFQQVLSDYPQSTVPACSKPSIGCTTTSTAARRWC